MRSVFGPRGAPCQHPSSDAALDGGPFGTLRATQRDSVGRYFQLRDV